jgi:hypothetical protein
MFLNIVLVAIIRKREQEQCKYLQSNSLSQQTLTYKILIKNLRRARPDFVISQ